MDNQLCSQLLSAYPVNKLSGAFARFVLSPCPSCGDERLTVILDSIAGLTAPLCTSCAAAKMIIYQFIRTPLIWDDVIPIYASFPLYRKMLRGLLSGISIFGPSVPQISGNPLIVNWNLTAKCDLDCLHCYSENRKRKPKDELTEKETLKMVDRLAEAGIASLTLTGGEPILRKDLLKVCRRAKNKGIYVRVETSGQIIDRGMSRKLKQSGVRSMIVSIDGGYPRTHDIFRQKSGCFMKSSMALSESKEVGFDELGVQMTLTGKSWMEVAMVYDHAKAMGANSFYVSSLLPFGKGRDLRMAVEPHQRLEIMRFLLNKLPVAINGKGPMTFTRHMPYYGRFVADAGTTLPDPIMYFALKSLGKGPEFDKSALRTSKFFTNLFSTSTVGINSCGLSNDGYMLPDVPLSSKMVNLKHKPINKAWRIEPLFNLLRDRSKFKGKCGSCVHKKACGGSRLQAFASGYDWLEADPSCPY